jgi:signal transduction histidine kinase
MRRFIPDTVAGRTLLVLLVGLTVSHVLSMAFYVSDRHTAFDLAGGEHLAEEIVTIARLVESAPAEERAELVRLADHAALRVSRGAESGLVADQGNGWQTDVLRRSFLQALSKLGKRDFVLRFGASQAPELPPGATDTRTRPDDGGKLLQVSLQIADGTWLNFRATVEPAESIWSIRFVLSMAVMIIAVVLSSSVVVYHLNRPLRVFARAARRLGRDVRSPPLPEVGPREVREAVEAFNEMQERIRRLLDDRTQMLTAISHDLRTPITLLRLRIEFVEDDEERVKILSTLDEMEAMVASILGFARDDAEREETRAVDFAALVRSICDDMADAGLSVDFDGPEKLTFACRVSALRRALTNIIDNAVKYGKRAHVRLMEESDAVGVVVEDEGPGIPEGEMERVFSPFYRVEESRSAETSGTGLGLTVARTIIVAHGGDVRLENREKGGVRVVVRLPR